MGLAIMLASYPCKYSKCHQKTIPVAFHYTVMVFTVSPYVLRGTENRSAGSQMRKWSHRSHVLPTIFTRWDWWVGLIMSTKLVSVPRLLRKTRLGRGELEACMWHDGHARLLIYCSLNSNLALFPGPLPYFNTSLGVASLSK